MRDGSLVTLESAPRFSLSAELPREVASQCQSPQGEGPYSKEQRADCGMRGGRSLRPREAGPPGGRGGAHDSEKYHEDHVQDLWYRSGKPPLLVTDPERCCRQCATSWSPKDIEYEGVRLKTTPGRSTTRLLGIHQSMWLDSSAQRRERERLFLLHNRTDLRCRIAL